MKTIIFCSALALLGGCASKPPQPAGCIGQFRPVNPVQQGGAVALDATHSLALCQGAVNGQS